MRSASTPCLFPPLILHAHTSADMFMAMALMGLTSRAICYGLAGVLEATFG